MYNKKEIFEKYLAGTCTPEEADWLVSLFAEKSFRTELEAFVDAEMNVPLEESDLIAELYDQSKKQYSILASLLVEEEVKTKRSKIRSFWPWAAAAAAIVVFYVGFNRYKTQERASLAAEVAAVATHPESVKDEPMMTLTLPDGKTIELTDTSKTQYASAETTGEESFFEIKKSDDTAKPMIQEISVSTGKTGGLVLTDGTKVWLNAGTKLRYDVNFVGSERIVYLVGEAYFEVAHNKAKPFVVISDDQKVRVLGTHFNIKAYTGNRTTTTLMEGSVAVSTDSKARILIPGESSVVNPGKANINVSPALLSNVNAWRNNEFSFYDADLAEIGSELSRWYGIDVQVLGQVNDLGFTGVISKEKTLEEVLSILRRTGQIKYQITPWGGKERRVLLMM